MNKRVACFLFCVCALVASIVSIPVFAETDSVDMAASVADGIIAWKKADNGAETDGYLINERFLELAGTTPGDWYPIGLARLGVTDNYDGYLAVIGDQIEERYRESGKLSAAKATEWHRISLAVLAAGGDPTCIGTDENGEPIDLIADGTYDRGKTTPLGRQGINGWIWGLITLDSMRYDVPDGAYYSRDDIIIEILRQQLADGGFALSGKTSDPDITAMALQALAPYYNSEKVYTYTQKALNREVVKTVRQTVEEALDRLSALQLDTGDYASWGTENVESTDQVVVALCSLGIDPLTDERFIKNGNTLLDGILRYRMKDGGFVHSFTYDPDNPTSLPYSSNTMAGEQTLYTMAAIMRQANGMRTLYDFREEQSAALKQRISGLEGKIDAVTSSTDKEQLSALLEEFYSLPENERSYVKNYWILSDASRESGVDISAIAEATVVTESSGDGEERTVLLFFSESDRRAVDSLPAELTTEQYVTVTTLLDKLEQSEAFDGKNEYLKRLTEAKGEIAELQAEIDSINADIIEKLYPFEQMSLRDKRTVDEIVDRYNALSEYDRGKIERWEDVLKTKTQLDNYFRGVIIGVVLLSFAVIIAVLLVRRVRRRYRRRELELEELAAMYGDEDD